MEANINIADSMSMKTGKGFNDGIYFDVNMHLQLFDSSNKLKEERFIHNAVTSEGKYGIADQLLSAPTLAKMGWMGIGTSTPTLTLLGAEIARLPFDSKTRSLAVVTSVCTFGAGVGTGSITEAGIFNNVAANSVDMWCSASFGVITKGASDVLTINWQIILA